MTWQRRRWLNIVLVKPGCYEALYVSEVWELYDLLRENIQIITDCNRDILRANPFHPSLHFKRVGRQWSVRVPASIISWQTGSGLTFKKYIMWMSSSTTQIPDLSRYRLLGRLLGSRSQAHSQTRAATAGCGAICGYRSAHAFHQAMAGR